MKPLLRRDGQAAFLGDGDEVSEVPQLHGAIPEKYGFDPTKSFSHAPARSTSRATAGETPQSGNQAGEDQAFRHGPTGICRKSKKQISPMMQAPELKDKAPPLAAVDTSF